MAIQRWDPFRDLAELRRTMDRWFEESFGRVNRLLPWEEGGGIAVDMYETDDAVVVKASLPGVSPDDVDISITGEALTLKGEARSKTEVKRENYYRQEMRYGAFSRTLPLPTRVIGDKAEAIFEHGLLTIILPKAEEAKTKVVKVKVKASQ